MTIVIVKILISKVKIAVLKIFFCQKIVFTESLAAWGGKGWNAIWQNSVLTCIFVKRGFLHQKHYQSLIPIPIPIPITNQYQYQYQHQYQYQFPARLIIVTITSLNCAAESRVSSRDSTSRNCRRKFSFITRRVIWKITQFSHLKRVTQKTNEIKIGEEIHIYQPPTPIFEHLSLLIHFKAFKPSYTF